MTITTGTKLGSFEIASRIGAGGMGEVWRAHDARIGRDVAIKVLPASFAADADRLHRFEQEARAAGTLNHPNLVTIYELGTHEGAPFIAMELLEGETLRDKLDRGPIPPRKAIDYAVQIANGLAAAHDKGVVHRDLKPENVFATPDGRVKILDFGLAKLAAPDAERVESEEQTMKKGTAPGTVMGTAGYMSPEQVRGQPVDHRTDIFTLGILLYEMLSGRRAFHAATVADTMSAILHGDPPELASATRHIPPAVDRIVRRCLEKEAAERFHSAHDLAFALDAVTASGATAIEAEMPRPRVARARAWLTVAAALLAVAAAVLADRFLIARSAMKTPLFRQLTFARGIVYHARFSPDGKTIVYDGSFNGEPSAIFTSRDDAPESRPLLPVPHLCAVSSKGELAVLVRTKSLHHLEHRGTLARVPLGGGTPREILEDVREADWSPDGSDLAVVRDVGGKCQLEFPPGHVLFATAGYISYMRMAPDGRNIAFFNHPVDLDDRGSLDVVDLQGHRKTLMDGAATEEGLAWRPDSKEVWFTSSKEGHNLPLYAVTLRGEQRTVLGIPGSVVLQDIAADGRLLLCHDTRRNSIYARGPADTADRDLSWFDGSLIGDIALDGKTITFTEVSEAVGPDYGVCMRDLSGGAAVRLGSGFSGGLSPDGRYVISQDPDKQTLTALPTGAGEPHAFPHAPAVNGIARWLPDGRAIVIFGQEKGHAAGYWLEFPSGTVHAIAGASVLQNAFDLAITVDGKAAAVDDRTTGRLWIIPFDDSKPREIPGARPFDRPVQWADATTLYVRAGDVQPAVIDLLDVTTGARRPWKTLGPADRAGQQQMFGVAMTRDGSAYAYTVTQELTELFLATGLK